MKHKLLIVDDDGFSAVHIEGLLGNAFEIEYAASGADGIEAIAKTRPSIVLMDVEMPDMDGYTACRHLKANEATHDIPVIFLSSHSDAEDRLKGYEVGGDDYIAKPFNPDVLRRKIGVVLRNRIKNAELATKAEVASQAAIAAMESLGDAGTILNVLREIAGSTDYRHISSVILETLHGYDVEASLQLRDDSGSYFRSSRGLCTPLEEAVLTNMRNCSRIVDLGARSAFNFDRVSVIINNMPRADPDRYGRIKDSVAMIVEAIDIHMKSLTLMFGAIERGDTLMRLIHRNTKIMRDIENRLSTQREESAKILNGLVTEIEDSFYWLGLSEQQESFLQKRARDAVHKAQALYDNGMETDAIMKSLTEGLDDALQQEMQGASDASAEDCRIELW